MPNRRDTTARSCGRTATRRFARFVVAVVIVDCTVAVTARSAPGMAVRDPIAAAAGPYRSVGFELVTGFPYEALVGCGFESPRTRRGLRHLRPGEIRIVDVRTRRALPTMVLPEPVLECLVDQLRLTPGVEVLMNLAPPRGTQPLAWPTMRRAPQVDVAREVQLGFPYFSGPFANWGAPTRHDWPCLPESSFHRARPWRPGSAVSLSPAEAAEAAAFAQFDWGVKARHHQFLFGAREGMPPEPEPPSPSAPAWCFPDGKKPILPRAHYVAEEDGGTHMIDVAIHDIFDPSGDSHIARGVLHMTDATAVIVLGDPRVDPKPNLLTMTDVREWTGLPPTAQCLRSRLLVPSNSAIAVDLDVRWLEVDDDVLASVDFPQRPWSVGQASKACEAGIKVCVGDLNDVDLHRITTGLLADAESRELSRTTLRLRLGEEARLGGATLSVADRELTWSLSVFPAVIGGNIRIYLRFSTRAEWGSVECPSEWWTEGVEAVGVLIRPSKEERMRVLTLMPRLVDAKGGADARSSLWCAPCPLPTCPRPPSNPNSPARGLVRA